MRKTIFITGLILLLSGIASDQGYSGYFVYNPEKVTVYPNPVIDGNLEIKADVKMEKIEIMSIVGQIVYSQELEPSNSVRLSFDLEKGIYLVKITFIDNTNSTKRIWVN
jgi:hypothetical protein